MKVSVLCLSSFLIVFASINPAFARPKQLDNINSNIEQSMPNNPISCPSGTTPLTNFSGPIQSKYCYPKKNEDPLKVCKDIANQACASAVAVLSNEKALTLACGADKTGGSCTVLGEPTLDGPKETEKTSGETGIKYSCKATATLCCTCLKSTEVSETLMSF